MSEEFELDEGILARLCMRARAEPEGTLILLPVRIDDRGIGQYHKELRTIPKELRFLDVPAVFLRAAAIIGSLIAGSERPSTSLF